MFRMFRIPPLFLTHVVCFKFNISPSWIHSLDAGYLKNNGLSLPSLLLKTFFRIHLMSGPHPAETWAALGLSESTVKSGCIPKTWFSYLGFFRFLLVFSCSYCSRMWYVQREALCFRERSGTNFLVKWAFPFVVSLGNRKGRDFWKGLHVYWFIDTAGRNKGRKCPFLSFSSTWNQNPASSSASPGKGPGWNF